MQDASTAAAAAVSSMGLTPPSAEGVFANGWETLGSMTSNVGGDDDTNPKLTHRLLLLLEGDWLFGKHVFDEARCRLIESVYIREEISDHQLAKFLLNDVIRYWRTIGVDFEYKTVEVGKGWGIRNIKLVYSRKLMYFGGLLLVAETAQSTRTEKVRRVKELVERTPIERIEALFGGDAERALRIYVDFLTAMEDRELRARLSAITLTGPKSEEFKRLKNDGHRFSLALEQLLDVGYPRSHPIHHALLF